PALFRLTVRQVTLPPTSNAAPGLNDVPPGYLMKKRPLVVKVFRFIDAFTWTIGSPEPMIVPVPATRFFGVTPGGAVGHCLRNGMKSTTPSGSIMASPVPPGLFGF